jgi:FkbM family methyltransferase
MSRFADSAVGRLLARLRRASKEDNRSDRRKAQLIAHLGIDLVIDVGANRGQYGRHLRAIGYRGPIVSLEPAGDAYAHLVEAAASDGRWTARRLALGARVERRKLHIAGNIGMSSSFLDMLPRHAAAAPESAYVGVEQVETVPLDDVFEGLRGAARRIFLKLDVQGIESHVLDGAARSLAQIDLLELESSLVPLYAGEALFPAMLARLEAAGFVLVGLSRGFDDARTGQLLQVDALFAPRARFPGTASP